MIRAWTFPLLMLAGAASPPCADAALCKCPPPPVADELARSEAVFTGVVTRIGEPRGEVVVRETRTTVDSATGFPVITATYGWEGERGIPVTLRVDRAWKGMAAGDSVEVLDSELCGVGFQQGEAYVVYAVRENGALRTSYCMRTRSLPHAADDARVLDSIIRASRP
ncbi:hypothetical protein [Longimicrobium sp.]|uniref:hypothetical protein n=1 Tax=Longimicrobium sp. TaxID=2029185 RepID=UPI002E30C800|nr:hypothetical protein [Longimicrobium sp.]HEX6039407.1 hypothetical protein [Longimicrobium sp.]